MEVTSDQWFAIMKWGQDTGKLKEWQCGISNTLSGYAAAGWKRKPSKKQALRGVEILKFAEIVHSKTK